MVRLAEPADAPALCALYNHYIKTSIVTFEEEPVTAEDFRHRIETILEAYPWLVYEEAGTIGGYVYAGPWKMRNAYRFSAEATVYLDEAFHGKGIGTALYEKLIQDLRNRDINAVMAGIALPNDGSVALHEKVGFRKVGYFEKLAVSSTSGSTSPIGNKCCGSDPTIAPAATARENDAMHRGRLSATWPNPNSPSTERRKRSTAIRRRHCCTSYAIRST